MNSSLNWPAEAACYPDETVRPFCAPGSNLVLDFHGDPCSAGLAIYSDGNHHMALEATLQAFRQKNRGVGDIFYTTAPPAALIDALRNKNGLVIGNLRISRLPDVFIGPDNILKMLFEEKLVTQHHAFAQSRGNVLLIRQGNPKGIQTLSDLLSDKITLTGSNPVTEKASLSVYREAVLRLADEQAIDAEALIRKLTESGARTVHSQIIHHREVPELIASGQADAAVIYYHLALRYSRIFPETFEFIDFNNSTGTEIKPLEPTTCYHAGLVESGGEWGKLFLAFIRSQEALDIYTYHGLNEPDNNNPG